MAILEAAFSEMLAFILFCVIIRVVIFLPIVNLKFFNFRVDLAGFCVLVFVVSKTSLTVSVDKIQQEFLAI